MKRTLRAFTAEGIGELKALLAICREERKTFPEEFDRLSADERYTDPLGDGREIDDERKFSSRLDLAGYLLSVLGPSYASALLESPGPVPGTGHGIWPWLSVVYWRQCIGRVAGRDRVGAEKRWILKTDFRDRNYHYMAFPVSLHLSVADFGPDALEAFLGGPVSENSAFSHECASRQEIMQNPAALQTAVWLYHAKSAKKKLRRRIASQKDPGNIRNFVRVLQQFGMTMDFFDREDAKILWTMLPKAFNRFKQKRIPWDEDLT
ncbi:MAG: hypothetical protein II839_06365 [Kiritimatiellae bacterium]|nr:hypothetical protein [Kiritimatiellia bacterium]